MNICYELKHGNLQVLIYAERTTAVATHSGCSYGDILRRLGQNVLNSEVLRLNIELILNDLALNHSNI